MLDRESNSISFYLMILIIILSATSGFLFYQTSQKTTALNKLKNDYKGLQRDYYIIYDQYLNLTNNYNNTISMYYELRDEYSYIQKIYSEILEDNSILQNQLLEIQNEHTNLQEDYSNILNEKLSLENELNEILNLEKKIILEANNTIEIEPNESVTFNYDTEYSGYIELYFNSSKDIFFWIGSSIIEDLYYARYPAFPNTATSGSFKTPVAKMIYVYIKNANEEFSTKITLSIKYVY